MSKESLAEKFMGMQTLKETRIRTHRSNFPDWTAAFLKTFAITCNCEKAAKAAGIAYETVYNRRKREPAFDAAYLDAQKIAAHVLEAEAVRRAKEGMRRLKFNPKTGEAYKDPETGQPYVEHEYSDNLMIALLKRHFPDQYRERQDINHSGEITTNLTFPVALVKAAQGQNTVEIEGFSGKQLPAQTKDETDNL